MTNDIPNPSDNKAKPEEVDAFSRKDFLWRTDRN
jgi:hypothetical protein